MKKGLLLVLMLLTVLVTSGCNTLDHQHTFDENWMYDSQYHWHESNCGHDVNSSKSEHVIVNGKCEFCNYVFNEEINKTNENYQVNKEKFRFQQVTNNQIYDYSIALDDYAEYHYFYLGTIYDAPVRISDSLLFNTTNYTYSFSFSNSVTEEFSKRKSEAEETVITKTTSNEYGKEFTSNSSISSELGVEEFGVSAKIIGTLSASESSSHNVTEVLDSSKGVTWTNEQEETISKTHETRSEVTLFLSEEDGFKKGYTYRAAYYKALDVYAVVEKDKITGKINYEIQSFFKKNENTTLVIEESKDGRFYDLTEFSTLSFDLDEAIEYIENNAKITDRISLDLYSTVSFVNEGGYEVEDTSKVKYGTDFKFIVPVRTGNYVFEGWFEKPNGQGKKYTNEQGNSLEPWKESEDIILYASWVQYANTISIGSISIGNNTDTSYSSEFNLGLNIKKLKELGYNNIKISISGYCSDYDSRMNNHERFFVLVDSVYGKLYQWTFKVKGFNSVADSYISIDKFNTTGQYKLGLFSCSSNYNEKLKVHTIEINVEAIK